MRTRRSVHAIEGNTSDETLLWYGRAIGELKQRPITDPRGWRFQAAIHAYQRGTDPFAVDGESLPSTQDQLDFWNQCQHGSWYFLPWHRMYLFHFEQLILSEVQRLGGPSDWALPYWNYSQDDPNSRLLPISFRAPTLSDGSPNHLFVSQRISDANAGNVIADETDVDLSNCLSKQRFSGPELGDTGFGGPQTGFMHSGRAPGALESIPHAMMHVRVGGNGFMSRFNTAALDPIFWLHHANIDRLWEVWKKRDPDHLDPESHQWLRGVSFQFHDVAGNRVTMRCQDVTDPTAHPLEYQYDDVSDPLPESFGVDETAGDIDVLQLIGATNEPFEVNLNATATQCVVRAPRSDNTVESFGVDSNVTRVFLSIEQLTCNGMATAIEIYLGLTPEADPESNPTHRVARLPLFGVREASEPTGPHAGSGLAFSLDITEAFQNLDDLGDDKFRDVPITLHPVGEHSGDAIRVGRVSLYAE